MRLKFDIQYVYIRTTPSPYIIYINKLFFFFKRYILRFALSRHIILLARLLSPRTKENR
jgi:hypothetical protein